jgi:hypothetical protein
MALRSESQNLRINPEIFPSKERGQLCAIRIGGVKGWCGDTPYDEKSTGATCRLLQWINRAKQRRPPSHYPKTPGGSRRNRGDGAASRPDGWTIEVFFRFFRHMPVCRHQREHQICLWKGCKTTLCDLRYDLLVLLRRDGRRQERACRNRKKSQFNRLPAGRVCPLSSRGVFWKSVPILRKVVIVSERICR